MDQTKEKLYNYIELFLKSDINGTEFEKIFTECFDFEDIDEGGQDFEYFNKIRQLLERFSPYKEDLEKYHNYYIDETQLRLKVNQLEF
jgi:hypothetical protein